MSWMTYWCRSLKHRPSSCLKGSTHSAANKEGWCSRLRAITSQPVTRKGLGDLVWAWGGGGTAECTLYGFRHALHGRVHLVRRRRGLMLHV
jgi:hypothetical protein